MKKAILFIILAVFILAGAGYYSRNADIFNSTGTEPVLAAPEIIGVETE